MATRGSSVPERIARWKVIAAGLTPQLAEMPHLAELHTELARIIGESEALDARHEALKAETREINRVRSELARSGDDVRNRLGAALRTLHGFDSEKLIEYGLKPRRPRGRDKAPRTRRTPPAAAGQPPPAQPAAPAQT
jgi:hypothetical protein